MKKPLIILLMILSIKAFSQEEPLRVGVIGLTHTHVHWIFGSEQRGEIKIVGIVEPNKVLAQRYADQHGYSMNLGIARSKVTCFTNAH